MSPKRVPAKLSQKIEPMLGTMIARPFNNPDWLFEIKWDGYRALAFISKSHVHLISRRGKPFLERFPTVEKQLSRLPFDAVLDGELVILDKEGRSHFQYLQNYQRTDEGDVIYYAFDLLSLNGKDLRSEPLYKRKELLKDLLQPLKGLSSVRFSDHIDEKGTEFFQLAVKQGLEGIMGKKRFSPYRSGRSQDWVKIKNIHQQEVVIGGFTAPKGSRKKFGALLTGVYEKDKLIYVGHVGGGFDSRSLEDVYTLLQPIAQKKCPFEEVPKTNAPATWVKPKYVCEVSFLEWTADKRMRQPIFLGMRSDKAPHDVHREMPLLFNVPDQSTGTNARKHILLANTEKVFWPKEKYTKGDLLNYYEKLAPYILPYLKDRPVVLRRYPDGIKGENFFQKDIENPPDWFKTLSIAHENRQVHYALIHNLDALLYLVNLGTIEIHSFNSKAKSLERPSYCVIDLDPHKVSFDAVVETALTIHQILEKAKVRHYCKTSGATGLHIYIPFGGKYTFAQAQKFAELIALMAHQKLPKMTTLERSLARRGKGVYIDCLQNRFGQTLATPYSVRGLPGAPVSAPVEWSEVESGLDPKDFTIESMPERLVRKKDLFKPVLGQAISLPAALQHLKRL